MEAKRGVFTLLLVVIMVCSAMAMAMAAPREDVGSSVNVVSSTPEITSASIDPAEITIIPAISQFATLTAEVFCPNGVDWMDRVEITKIRPYSPPDVSVPTPMKLVSVEDGIRAKYALKLAIPCNMPADNYTFTVTATDKDGNSATGTATCTILETLAISVTDVNFGSVAPGASEKANSTITNQGNVRALFEVPDGIVPADMHSGSDMIAAENVVVKWDWRAKTVLRTGFFKPGKNTKEIQFTLNVPYGTPPGTYTGRIVFTPTPE